MRFDELEEFANQAEEFCGIVPTLLPQGVA